jgi:hypothetical protein
MLTCHALVEIEAARMLPVAMDGITICSLGGMN